MNDFNELFEYCKLLKKILELHSKRIEKLEKELKKINDRPD
jgi:flagellar biosynthesis chaperone FliJ